MNRRAAPTLLLLLLLAAPVSTARSDDVGPPLADAAGDCTASPCADLLSVTPGLIGQTLTFRLSAAGLWRDFLHPPLSPLPQIWIWTTSPDTAPPDATVTERGAHIVGGPSFAVFVNDLDNGSDMIGPTRNILREVGMAGDDVPGFLTSLGGPFRWRVTLPTSETITWGPERPVDPHPADSAPDSGSIEYRLPDGDADGLPDTGDPCPAAAFRAQALGWSLEVPRDGCPAPEPPFTARAFKRAATKAARSFRALWRDHSRRVNAIRSRRIKLRLRIPAGRGQVRAAVSLAHPDAPRPPSVHGGRTCAAGRCVIRMKVVPEGVRAYRRKALILSFTFTAGRGRGRQDTTVTTRLRMPAKDAEIGGVGSQPPRNPR